MKIEVSLMELKPYYTNHCGEDIPSRDTTGDIEIKREAKVRLVSLKPQ
jgi:hypothetical protein